MLEWLEESLEKRAILGESDWEPARFWRDPERKV
jgi:hypothetical protein